MKIGVQFPTNEIGSDPAAIRDFAQAADNLGFDSLSTYEHVVGAVHADREPPFPDGAFDETHDFHEPMTLFGYIAGITENINMTTGIMILPQRQTVLLAKQAAQLSVLSGGRLRLAFGSGWSQAEYEALGVPFGKRGKRMDEQIKLLRELWTGEVVDFDDEFHRVDRCSISPPPVKPIPIYLGGFAPVALRRAANVADGYTFGATMVPEVCETLWEELDKAGRKREDFGIESSIHVSAGVDKYREAVEYRKQWGTTVFYLRMNDQVGYSGEQPANFTSVDQFIGAMETFKETVADLL